MLTISIRSDDVYNMFSWLGLYFLISYQFCNTPTTSLIFAFCWYLPFDICILSQRYKIEVKFSPAISTVLFSITLFCKANRTTKSFYRCKKFFLSLPVFLLIEHQLILQCLIQVINSYSKYQTKRFHYHYMLWLSLEGIKS